MSDDVARRRNPSLTCRFPVEAEHGEILVSVCDTDREVLAQYPLAQELLKLFRQSSLYKDQKAQVADSRTDPCVFDTRQAKERAAPRPDLLKDDPVETERALTILKSPIQAVQVAQVWEQARRKKINRFSLAFREVFFEALQSVVSPEVAEKWFERSCPTTQLRAVEEFCKQTSELLKKWMLAGKSIYRWKYENPGDVYMLQLARSQVRRTCAVDSPLTGRTLWLPWEEAPIADDVVPVSLLGNVRLEGDLGIRQAAGALSYLTFRQFLLIRTKVSFCGRCGGVFEMVKNRRKFCTNCCSKYGTESKRKYKKRANTNCERVVKAIGILMEWFANPRKQKWRNYLENGLRNNKLSEANRKKSQIVGRWIKAAHSPNHSKERRSLFRLCTHSKPTTRSGKKMDHLIDQLLWLIVNAEIKDA